MKQFSLLFATFLFGATAAYEYLGCFRDTGTRALPYSFANSGSNSIEWCVAHCLSRDHTLAGLQYTSQCFCGNDNTAYNRYGTGTGCTATCPGNRSQRCGGTWHNSVYRVAAIETNECDPNPCLNGGTCTDGDKTFTCACAPGYEGATCNTNINECDPNPCQHGGTCTDGVNSYTCACALGYEGTSCETMICPETYAYVERFDSCFYFSDTAIWKRAEAEAACNLDGATLFTFESLDELNYVRDLLLNNPEYNRFPKWWIAGARETPTSHVWSWGLEGDLITAELLFWGEKEPNNHRGNETCMNLLQTRDYWLNDAFCNREMAYICRK